MIFWRRDFNVSENFHHVLLGFLVIWDFLSHILTQEEYHTFMVVQLLIDDCSGCLCIKIELKFYLYTDVFVFNAVYNLEMWKTFQYLISVFICNIHPNNMPI